MNELDNLFKVLRIAIIVIITIIVLRLCLGLFIVKSIVSNNHDEKVIYETNIDWYKDKPHAK